jgi:gas vesicle protein
VNDDSSFSKSSIFVSFVAGGLTGAAVALLLAPQSGDRTRKELKDRINDEVERGRKASQRIADKGRDVLEQASSSLGKL